MTGFAAAIAGTLLYGVASVAQSYAAQRASGAAVLRHPVYLAGLGCDLLAWIASLVALRSLPLFAVQSLLAGSLAVTVVLAALVLHVPVGPAGRVATAGVVLGLVLVSWSAGPESTLAAPGWFVALLGALFAAVVLAALALYGRGGSIALAAVAALGFSGAAMAARALATAPLDLAHLVTDPVAWMVLAFGVVGAVLYARSLERGEVGPATATLWVIEVLVPGGVGVLVLGDTVRPGTTVPAVVGIALAVVGTVVLARSGAGEPVIRRWPAEGPR
jgi:drug/metabolite transporter (DMT)-like permease